jgi:hypothetical protein
MARSELLRLHDDFGVVIRNRGPYPVRLVPQDEYHLLGVQFGYRIQDMPYQRHSRKRMQGLGKAGLHARAQACGENDGRGLHLNYLRGLLPEIIHLELVQGDQARAASDVVGGKHAENSDFFHEGNITDFAWMLQAFFGKRPCSTGGINTAAYFLSFPRKRV